MLLPYQTFEAYKRGDSGLLIPVSQDPPLLGAHLFHAKLYSLQMEVLSEFSKQSIQLYQSGSITIFKSKWNDLCRNNAILGTFAEQVLDRWTNDGNDRPKFLEALDSEHYTLGAAYSKELIFLKEQGFRRLNACIAGKISSTSKTQ